MKTELGLHYLDANCLNKGAVVIPHKAADYLRIWNEDEGRFCTSGELTSYFAFDDQNVVVSDSTYEYIKSTYGDCIKQVELLISADDEPIEHRYAPVSELTVINLDDEESLEIKCADEDSHCKSIIKLSEFAGSLADGAVPKDVLMFLAAVMDAEQVPLEEVEEFVADHDNITLPVYIDCCDGKAIKALLDYANSPDEDEVTDEDESTS